MRKIILSFFIITSFISIAQVESGLVAKYSFNSGNATDDIGSNDGTVLGATLTTDRFGNTNHAYNFINGDLITLPDAPELKSNEMTVSLWVDIDSFTVSNVGTNYIYSVINSPTAAFFATFAMTVNTGDYKYFSVAQDGPSESIFGASINDTTSTWQHYVLSIDDDSIKMYIDGALQFALLKAFTTDYTSDLIYIGGSGNSSFYGNTNASIDDIRVYNRVLLPIEVDSLYNEIDPEFGVGFKENSALSFSVYPNPSNETITINSIQPSVFVLYNALGEVMFSQLIQQNYTLDISSLESGIYFLKNDEGQTAKLIKQ